MSLEDLYARDIEANYLRAVTANRPPPEASFSLWSALGAGFSGVPGGLLEITGSGADVLAPAQRSVQRRPRPAVLRDQPEPRFDNVDGNVFRAKAAEFAPDPQTAHFADQALYGIGRFGSKAAAAMLAAGPVAGAALLGAEETNTQYRGLLEKGVDPDTALLTGMTLGAAGAVGVALPISGAGMASTLQGQIAATAGLVAIGGPGLYMAQEAAARQILGAAGYDAEAATHDPTDPLGLALSTILPGGFGAWSVRNAARQARLSRMATPKTEAQIREAAALNPEEQAASDAFERSDANLAQLRAAIKAEKNPENRAVLEQELATQEAAARAAARDPVQPADPETMDAARALQVERALSNNLPDMPNARGMVLEAMDEVAAGRFPEVPAPRSQVVDSAAALRAAAEPNPWDEPRVVEPMAAQFIADDLRGMAMGAEWAVRGGQLLRSGVAEAGDQSLGGFVTGRTPWVPAQEWYARMRSSLGDAGLSERADIEIAVEKAIRNKRLSAREQRTVDWMRQEVADMREKMKRMEFAPDEAEFLSSAGMAAGLSRADTGDVALTARAAEIDEAAVERAAIQFADDDAGFMGEIRRILDEDATANAGRDRVNVRAQEANAIPRDDAAPEPAAQRAEPAEPAAPLGKPRDLKAELIAARKSESLLRSLLECLG